MPWGEPHEPRPAQVSPTTVAATHNLAAAVRRFLKAGTTGHREELGAALDRFDRDARFD